MLGNDYQRKHHVPFGRGPAYGQVQRKERFDGIEVIDPLDRIRETKDEAEALRLALQEIRDTVWTPKISMPMLRKRVAQVLLAVHNRGRLA